MEFTIFGKKFSVKNSKASDSFMEFLRGSGYEVSSETALKVAVVLRCADVVAKTMASLGCHLYVRKKGDKIRAVDEPLYDILRMQPNPETTAYEFWHMYVFSLMLTEGAYAVVKRKNGFVSEIWNVPSKNATIKRNKENKKLYLEITDGKMKYEEYEYMHTPGLRFNSAADPENFIKIAGDVLNLSMNLNNYAKDYFENGSNLGGFITYPSKINEQAFTRFKEDWEKAYSGVVNSHRWAILEGGFDLKQLQSNPSDSQALESRKFQIHEVCRIMGVTPHKVFALEGVNYNSIEQLNIEFWQETINPMDERITQTIYKDLLLPREKGVLFAKFNTNKLLKGDTAARTTYYHNARQDGWMSANDIRDLEDMNKIPAADGGDLYALNGNMIPLSAVPMNLPKGAK